MDKEELIHAIRVKHRQLKRYLYYFEKNEEGVFVASDRPKFGIEEMLQPGVFQEWSLKDLLSHLIDWEQRFLDWYYDGLAGKTPSDLLPADLHWEDIDAVEFTAPQHLQARSMIDLLVQLKDSHARVVSTASSISEHELFTPAYFGWTGEASLADYLALATYRHYDWAKGLIRAWRKRHAGKYLNKKVILERIRTERRRLEQNLNDLADNQMVEEGVVGRWTIRDLLAHLADWEQRFISWYESGKRGEVPEIPAPGIGWEDLDLLNQQIFKGNRTRSLEDIRHEFSESYHQVLTLVESIPEEEIFAVGRYTWLGESNLANYILANTADHYRWAKEQIRNWLNSRNKARR